MRRLIHTIIQVLDGTPAVYGKRQNGQSLVEMALITPILIILFMGMVEIGWFANNYLTLLDVTRAGARRAANLQEQFSPLQWDNRASYVPVSVVNADGINLGISGNDYWQDGDGQGLRLIFSPLLARPLPASEPELTQEFNARNNQRVCGGNPNRLFYLEIVCVMLASMDPLRLDAENNIDDIIVSGFSLARIVDPPGNPVFRGPNALPAQLDASTETSVAVVGRYPTNANECELDVQNPTTAPTFVLNTARSSSSVADFREPRDPFDVNENGVRDMRAADTEDGNPVGNGQFTEREGYDAPATTIDGAERQVGYAYNGQRWIPGSGCVGSAFTVRRIEELVNLPTFDMDEEARRARLPHQGLVLVEMYWEHEMLLRFPVFNPVVAAMAGDLTPTISVWAAFPLPSLEPTNATMGFPPNQ